jgi:gliding motility-associated-like protein
MIRHLFLKLTVCFFFINTVLNAQCTYVSSISDVTLNCFGGSSSRSGVAYNPTLKLYYSVNAGLSSFPLETFSEYGGNPISTTNCGVDYRGYWWNSSTGLPEGNTYNSGGLYSNSLNGSGYATNTANFIASANMPNSQANGAGNVAGNIVFYYDNGVIYKYVRSTGAFISSVTITGLPVSVSNIAVYALAYTGIAGSEAIIYDYVLKKVYFINYTTGAYVSTCSLSGIPAANGTYGISFCNNRIFIFDTGTFQWYGFPITNNTTCAASALNFDGVNDFVYFPTPASWWNLGSNFTVEMWIKPQTLNNQILLYAGYGCITCPQWVLTIGPELTCGYGGTSGKIVFTTIMGCQIESDASPTPWTWTHVAVTFGGGIMKMYIDGKLQQMVSKLPNGSVGNPSYMAMGMDPGCGGRYPYGGSIDEFRVWNVERTQCQIEQYMKCQIPTTATNLLCNFHFDQGNANASNGGVTSLTDAAGSALGSLNSFALSGPLSNWVAPSPVVNSFTTAAAQTVSINITGNGSTIVDGDTSPSTSDFTDFNGNSSRTFVIQNAISGGTLDIGAYFTGAAANDFSITTVPSSSIVGIGSTSVIITVLTGGLRTATLNIVNNDCSKSLYDFVITANLTKNQALNTDGVDDYVFLPNSLLYDFTIEYWMRTTQTAGTGLQWWNGVGIVDAETPGVNDDFGTALVGSKLAFGIGNPDVSIFSTSDVNTGQWVHIAATRTSSNGAMNLYVNGVLEATSFASGSGRYAPWGITVGSMLTLITYYQGDIDDLRLWNTVRTQCQIQQYMNCEIPSSTTNLVGNYHFNQGTAASNATVTTLIDDSGIFNWGAPPNGTLYNFALSGSTSNWITTGKIATDYTVPSSPSATISVKGNGNTITNNSTGTSTLNLTSFGSVSTRSFVVQNIGTGLLTINSVTLSGTNSSEFSVTAISSGTMGTSGTSTVVVAFTPTAGGLKTATVEILSTDCTTPLFKFAIDGQAPTAEALSLDGVNDVASRAILTTNTTNLTLQAKVYWRGTTSQAQMIVYNGHSSIRGYGIYNNLGSGAIQILYGGVSFTPFNYTLSTNVWTSLTAVIKNGSVECYVNGVLVSVTNVSNPSTPNSGLGDLFTVGSNAVGAENFNGIVDEVRFWDKALSQCEIQTYLNCEIPGAMTNLLANYHFNQGAPGLSNTSVNTATDASGNNNTLNLVNMALTGTLSNWVSPGAVVSGFTTTTPPTASITVTGNGSGISFGSTSTSTLNYTDFGSAASRTFVIQNSGTGTLNIGTPYFTGGNASEFSVTVLPATTLAASATTSFVVAFNPTGGGARTATVNINDNDCGKPIFIYAIQGTPQVGAALNFDGVDDYINLPSNSLPTGNSNFTFEFWVKLKSAQTGHRWITSIGSATSGSLVTIGFDGSAGNKIRVHHFGPDLVATTASIPLNAWTHVAVNYNGNSYTSEIYINGAYIETLSFGVPLTIPANPNFQIGSFASTPTYCPNMDLDELRIWNRVLCSAEIQNNMNCEIATTGTGLVGNYHFNHGYSGVNNSTVTLITDVSGSANTGTLTSFALTGTTSNWVAPGAVTTGSSCGVYLNPEINLVGNGNSITDGDITPSTTDNTDFGAVCVNANVIKSFTIQNTGASTLSVGSMSITGSGAGSFTIGTLSPASPIAAAGSAVFSVTFAPATSGVKTATINIPSNDCDESLYDFVLTGTCNALPTVSASASSSVVCSGFSTILSGSGANTYTWTGGVPTVTNGVAFTPTASLTYTVNGTNTLTGCTSTNSATQGVTVNPTPTVAVSTVSSAICINGSTTLTATNANTYTWNPGGIVGGTVTVAPTANTSYTATGTNITTGCTSTNAAVLNITVNALPTVTASATSTVICFGATTSLTASGASTYTWNPGSLTGSNVPVTPAATTNYSLVGTSTAGCTSTNSAVRTITVNPLPSVSITPVTTVVCAGFPANLVGIGANTYTWNPGGISGTTLTPSPLTTTGYSLVGTSTAGCTSTNSAVQSVSVNALPVIAVSSVSMSICINGSTTLTANNAHTYTWNPGALTGSQVIVSPTSNTGYTATGTSTITGCTSTNVAVLNITVNALPTVTASVNGSVICFGNSPTLTASGANTYTWNPSNMIGATQTPTPAANTTYTLVGTSTAGCTSTNSATSSVTVNPLPTVSITPVTTVVCAGFPANLVGTGANTYTWNPGGTPGTTITPSPLTTTSYSLVGTSTAGCTSTNSAVQSVSVNALPTVSASASNSVICNTGTTSLIGLGADTYTWSGSIPNNTPFSPSSTTSYTVNGTNTLTGCTSTNSAVQTISVNVTPSVNVSAVNTTVCAGVTTTITASGANTYSWNPGALTGSLITPNPTITTTYTVIGGSAAGCLSTPVTQTINVNALPLVTANASSLATCFGGSVTLNGNGASTYAWSGGVPTVTNGVAFSPTTTTSYTVTGTDANNCQNTASLTITVYVLPVVSANITNTTICLDDQVTLLGSGATNYTWTGGISDGVAFSPAATSSYNLVGSFTTGCTSTNAAVASVSVNPLPVVIALVSNSVICLGDQSTLSGAGAINYVWTGGVTNNVAFSPSITDSYTVVGTDANTCTNSAVASITVNSLPVLTVVSTSSTNCEAVTVTLTVSGANSYTWNTNLNGTDLVITPTVSTTYTVNALDLNGCANTATFMQLVSVCPGTINAFPHVKDLSCHGKNDGKIFIEVNHTYTNAAVQYFWNGQNCPTNDCDSLNKLKNGTYSVLVKVTYTLNNVLVKTDSVMLSQIEVRDELGDCEIKVYNGISANGDGLNDVLAIYNIDQFPTNKVSVYTRWGEKVFEVSGYNNLDKSWPVAGESAKLPPNTYFYIIDKGDGSKVVKGWVELIK